MFSVKQFSVKHPWARALAPYVIATCATCLGTYLTVLAHPFAPVEDLLLIHVLIAVLVAAAFKPTASLVACVLGTLAFAFLLIPPRFGFGGVTLRQSIVFVAVVLVTSIVSMLNHRLRYHERVAREGAFRAETLYDLSGRLASAESPQALVEIARKKLEECGQSPVVITLGDPNAAPMGGGLWLPIEGTRKVFGTIQLGPGARRFAPTDARFSDRRPELLFKAVAGQLGQSLERLEMTAAIRRSELEAERERMKNSMLSGFSHDLKTPLSTILAAGTTLLSHGPRLDALTTHQLLSTVVQESDRMNRLIQNVLFFSRLSSPSIELRCSAEAIEDIVSGSLDRVQPRIARERITVSVEDDLPLVRVEPILIEQVLVNLLENAGKYATPEPAVYVRLARHSAGLKVSIGDNGPGIAVHERDLIFRKFYRGEGTLARDGGMGLGLTICQAVVNAHGSTLEVGVSEWGGALFEFTLPRESRPASRDPLA